MSLVGGGGRESACDCHDRSGDQGSSVPRADAEDAKQRQRARMRELAEQRRRAAEEQRARAEQAQGRADGPVDVTSLWRK